MNEDRDTQAAWEAEIDMLRAGPVTQAALDELDGRNGVEAESLPSTFRTPSRRLRPVEFVPRRDDLAPTGAPLCQQCLGHGCARCR